jgi:hypothetical protein
MGGTALWRPKNDSPQPPFRERRRGTAFPESETKNAEFRINFCEILPQISENSRKKWIDFPFILCYNICCWQFAGVPI